MTWVKMGLSFLTGSYYVAQDGPQFVIFPLQQSPNKKIKIKKIIVQSKKAGRASPHSAEMAVSRGFILYLVFGDI